mmetsp:Transcript_2261/g.6748  ORF Transcript_2261/g.6748 Transcript_2261/m.6748 type:complete len:328 (+) Transcript_2261:756-1739(+)|eukprot:CAMPEP_0198728398 /NCGR_PEP_ID=MMETSP1475-20131203/9064_1 /TAXON_ID= ORGANISM="Unidentified sp., Strain CCMP1999" /NCGR_SAMPLE_ID=MMETSP1475 /ASSEMBLY_ACC=CAM_ASM_001111 /LENGTH=327 /DNA_ID=CAMNT_0044490753 /DNA_START=612 /DNA_END=1595 /DNA_ORIENTATION=-
MSYSDDVRRNLYAAFAAYNGSVKPTSAAHNSDALTVLDSIFEAVVGSMTADVREKFVSSLQDGSSAFQMIGGLLQDDAHAAQMRTVDAGRERVNVEQAQLENEVIRLLYQLPRERIGDSSRPKFKFEDDFHPASSDSKTDKKLSDITDASNSIKAEAKMEQISSNMLAAEALMQSSRSVSKRARQYSDPVPSEHCHICCRPTRKLKFAVCSNIRRSMCRKVVCVKCFEAFQWDWDYASAADTDWVCTHCRDDCPKRAQCFVYERINSRRRKKNREVLPSGKLNDADSGLKPPPAIKVAPKRAEFGNMMLGRVSADQAAAPNSTTSEH